MSSPPKYIKFFICLRSPWALFIMPVIEFLCEKVLWKPLISWVFRRLSWHLTNFVIRQIVQGGSTFFFGQWNLTVSDNSTKPSYWAVRFWTNVFYFVACAVLMTQNEDTSVKKNSSCHSVAWYHWRSQKIGCICFLISNSVGNVNFHISNFQHTAILLKVYNWTELIWIFV